MWPSSLPVLSAIQDVTHLSQLLWQLPQYCFFIKELPLVSVLEVLGYPVPGLPGQLPVRHVLLHLLHLHQSKIIIICWSCWPCLPSPCTASWRSPSSGWCWWRGRGSWRSRWRPPSCWTWSATGPSCSVGGTCRSRCRACGTWPWREPRSTARTTRSAARWRMSWEIRKQFDQQLRIFRNT